MYATLEVDLGERTYPIYIGQGLLETPALWEGLLGSRQVLVVSNTTVAALWWPTLQKTLSTLARPPSKLELFALPDGEQFKELNHLNDIFTALLEHRFDRSACLLALGGGVVGDMTGFAASAYQRGVEFIQVPTTLLSQVDSSVGGKTGVNHPLGKNMIGAFYQPKAVIIDTRVMATLPARELSAGLAEIIKYGLIDDPVFLTWLEQHMDDLLAKDTEALSYAIKTSCEIKARIVASDEKESGARALLNFGHTYGHAIETHQGYGAWLHGEAVAVGMQMAAELSQKMGWITADAVERVSAILRRANLPTQPPGNMCGEDFRQGMAVDKKVQEGRLRLVLLKSLGQAVVTDDFDHHQFNEQLARLGQLNTQ
jgi:3-dehydroquinate synthase